MFTYLEGGGGSYGGSDAIHCLEGVDEILADELSYFLGFAVEGVVVASGECVGAEA